MSCACSYDYDEVATLFNVVVRRARKQHKCCECRRPIEKRFVYAHISILFDGRWSDHKQCGDCMEAFAMAEEFGCPYVEGLAMEINESWSHYRPDVQNYFRKKIPFLLWEKNLGLEK